MHFLKGRVALFHMCSDLFIARLIYDSWILAFAYAFNLFKISHIIKLENTVFSWDIKSEKGK